VKPETITGLVGIIETKLCDGEPTSTIDPLDALYALEDGVERVHEQNRALRTEVERLRGALEKIVDLEDEEPWVLRDIAKTALDAAGERHMAEECKHGQLARSCEICELEAEIKRLRDALQGVADIGDDESLSDETAAVRMEEVARAALDAAGE